MDKFVIDYIQEVFKLDGDSVLYYERLGDAESVSGNLEKAIEFFKSQDVDFMFCLMVADKRLRKIFRKKGFIFSPFLQGRFSEEGQFCAYTNHPNISKTFLMNKENWFIQLGDSDSI